ncbi:AraC family transcriptional regulator [Nonomuraea sp. NPDC048892]|uniref:AraC family transcriptional regulator n=1 Tax=Nonomuraea sp. NPDC048892 TaxID=3154624 RepID=UPI0033E5D016
MPATLHAHALFAGSPVLAGVHHLDLDVEPHAHDFLEIAVIGAGDGRHVTSQGERTLRLGQVIVLRPGAWHGLRDCAGLTVANCCLSAQALRAELALLYDIPMLRGLLWTDPVASGTHGVAVTTVGPAVAEEAIAEIGLLERDLGAGRSRPGRVLGRLVTVLGVLADGRDLVREAPEPAVSPAVAATIARLEAEPAHPWRLDDLARAVNLDPAYLGRLFVRHVGLTPLRFLARLRAERAATLLAHSALPAARVGAAVGWDDPTYFARRFRTLVGLTPTEYRRRSRSATHWSGAGRPETQEPAGGRPETQRAGP